MNTYMYFCTHFERHLLHIYRKEGYFEQRYTQTIEHTLSSINVCIILIFFEEETHGKKYTKPIASHTDLHSPTRSSHN